MDLSWNPIENIVFIIFLHKNTKAHVQSALVEQYTAEQTVRSKDTADWRKDPKKETFSLQN